MYGAPRTVRTSDLIRALDQAPSVTAAARIAGCARTAVYKRADREPLIMAALRRCQARKGSSTGRAPGTQPTAEARREARRDVEETSEQVEAGTLPAPPPAPSPDLPPAERQVEVVYRAMLAQQTQIARDPDVRADVRVRAADSALRWAVARLALLRTPASDAPDTLTVEGQVQERQRRSEPMSSREVAQLIKFDPRRADGRREA